ncbi:hypothetical protein [Streptomyces sp. NPDC006463]|uniref:hypothetical protein n=1 Tax=Streptomyces sp. NPDC006463 TaxID=3364746 RepID=UPI00369912A2
MHFVEREPDMMAIGGRLLADIGPDADVMVIDVAVMDGDWRQEVRAVVIERVLAAMADACGLPQPSPTWWVNFRVIDEGSWGSSGGVLSILSLLDGGEFTEEKAKAIRPLIGMGGRAGLMGARAARSRRPACVGLCDGQPVAAKAVPTATASRSPPACSATAGRSTGKGKGRARSLPFGPPFRRTPARGSAAAAAGRPGVRPDGCVAAGQLPVAPAMRASSCSAVRSRGWVLRWARHMAPVPSRPRR